MRLLIQDLREHIAYLSAKKSEFILLLGRQRLFVHLSFASGLDFSYFDDCGTNLLFAHQKSKIYSERAALMGGLRNTSELAFYRPITGKTCAVFQSCYVSVFQSHGIFQRVERIVGRW